MVEDPARFARLSELFRQAEMQLKQAEEIERNFTIPAAYEEGR